MAPCCAKIGLIPAHAGKTAVRSERVNCGQAHPRSRGENPTRLPRGGRASGSSPLTRGKHENVRGSLTSGALIPAHAGKTRLRDTFGFPLLAHPRSRGENSAMASLASLFGGSSPLTRGKQCSEAGPVPQLGLIPAHAGKTREVAFLTGATTAHPRSRGENITAAGPALRADGSSPLTRGKLGWPAIHVLDVRLIPAHAGKTR